MIKFQHISLEVLDKKEHAIKFYENNNYIICDENIHTLKYVELKMEKYL